MNAHSPVALVILDGFGYSKDPRYNAIQHARTPHLDFLLASFPHTLLKASGEAVGLLPGFMGNSEVGHLTIGSGRVIPQPVLRLHNAIQNGSFFENNVLKDALSIIKQKNATLHIMGLLSDGGVHSHEEDLFAFLKAAHLNGLKNIIIHPFLDGRDTPPQSARLYLEKLESFLHTLGVGTLGSLHGRWFAMDRDKHWERTLASYTTLTRPIKSNFTSWQAALEHFYNENITDEFIPPTSLGAPGIANGDGVIFFNYRPDRARQLTQLFLDPAMSERAAGQPSLSAFVTPTTYGLTSTPLQHYMLEPISVPNTLKEVLVAYNKSLFTIAETEKYAHVTYFFCGGKEEALKNEIRLLIPSIPAKTYVEHPAMSAPLITEAVRKSLTTSPKDFYLINYANADMVGHSGNFSATVRAIECLDEQLALLYEAIVERHNGTLLITADHGNAERKADPETGAPLTSHSTNPVPFIHVASTIRNSTTPLPLQELADIAPYILNMEQLPIPSEMAQRTSHDI